MTFTLQSEELFIHLWPAVREIGTLLVLQSQKRVGGNIGICWMVPDPSFIYLGIFCVCVLRDGKLFRQLKVTCSLL